jgi:hypothetical protein
MLPEGSRPHLGDGMRPGREASCGTDLGQAGASEIDKSKRSGCLYKCHDSLVKLALTNRVHTRTSTERFDECSIKRLGNIQDAISSSRIVESIRPGGAEEDRGVDLAVNPKPRSCQLDNR